MNWDAVGAISELVSAAAVLVTLIYLARQLREGNTYARASKIQETNTSYIQVFSQLVQNPDTASLYAKAMSGTVLNESEGVQFAAFTNTFFAWLEAAYFQSAAAYLTDEISGGDSIIKMASPYAGRLLDVEAARNWWRTDAPSLFTPEFVTKINEHVAQKPSTADALTPPPNNACMNSSRK